MQKTMALHVIVYPIKGAIFKLCLYHIPGCLDAILY